MKRILVTLIFGALMCGCTTSLHEEAPAQSQQVAEEGNTVFRFSTSAISVTTRNAEDSYASEQGTESEWKVNKVCVYLFDSKTKLIAKTLKLSSLSRSNDGANGYITYTSNHVMVSQGTYDIFAVANTDNIINVSTEEEFINAIDEDTYKIGQIVDTSNGIIMSNRASANINTEIKGFEDKSKENEVNIVLERVAARLDVARNSESYQLKDKSGNQYATVSLNGFHYVNLSTKFYVFRHTATLTSMTEPQWDINTHFGNVGDVDSYVIDPYFFNKKIDATNFSNEDAYYVNFLSNNFKGDNVKWTNFKEVSTTPNYNTCYALENCQIQAAQKNGYSSGVVFRAEVNPNNNIYTLNTNSDKLELLSGQTEKPNTLYYHNYKFYDSANALAKDGVTVTDEMSEEDLNFLKTKRFNKENGKYYTYYTYWIKHLDNNDPNAMGVMEFAIVRNNLYRMLITNVSDLGSGEYKPNPDRPDEGEAYLKVELNVKPWIVRDQTDIVL